MIVYGEETISTPVIIKAIGDKVKENTRLSHLRDYYDGKQDILLRFYEDPTKPNNRIVVNYCKHISDFLTSYLVGQPVYYKDAPTPLLKTLEYNDESESLSKAVTDMNNFGFGCELFYIDEDGNARYSTIPPEECIYFMDNSLQQNITAFVRVVKRPEEKGGYDVTLYSAEDYQEFLCDEAVSTLTPVSEKIVHYWRDVPVNIYQNGENMQGSYEQIIPLQDALNKLTSDNVNDFESFVDSYLVLEGMQGTTSEDIEEMKTQRVLLTDRDSKAYWLTKQVNKDHVKQLQDDLRANILEMGNCPDLKDMTSGITDISGVGIRMKLIKTEIAASRQERYVTKAIQRKIELLYNILSIGSSEDSYTKVVPLFTRNFLMTDEEKMTESGWGRFGYDTTGKE